MPLSASMTARSARTDCRRSSTGRIVAEAGSIGDANDDDGRITIDRAEFKFNWDAAHRVLSVPFQILSGGNRITLLGQIEAPPEAGGIWSFKVGGGTVVLDLSGAASDPPLVLNRIAISGRYDAGQATLHRRRGRYRQYRRRRRHVRQLGFFRRRLLA